MDRGAWWATVQSKLSHSCMAHILLLDTKGVTWSLVTWPGEPLCSYFCPVLYTMIGFALCHSHCSLCDHLGDLTVKTPLGCAFPRDFTNHRDCCVQPFLTTFGPRDSSGSLFSCSSPCLLVQCSVFCFLVHASEVPLIGTPSLWSPCCSSQEVESCGSPSSGG